MPTEPIKHCTLFDTAEVESMLDVMALACASLLEGRPACLVGILRRGAPIDGACVVLSTARAGSLL